MTHVLNRYFDKIFIISINRNVHRINQFLKNHPDIEVEIFHGVDGKELYPSIDHVCNFPQSFFDENHLYYDRCKNWNKGQIGCALSNFLVQKEILDRQLERVLILEDDAQLISDRLPVFNKAIKELPTDWDLFYLGYTPLSKWSENSFFSFFLKLRHLINPVIAEGLSSGALTKRFFSKPYSKLLKLPGVYLGAHAYALSYKGAKKMISLDTPMKLGADRMLMHATYHKLVKGYALKNPLFIPNPNFETSIIN